ncbi:hypothetical protein [Nitrosococcus watsonii]|uniref:hypothetical protein n=1 Tax=Nitrosococcus watsonii TaxID=473531 RepID=UPI0002ECE4A8|nr:hypothetical protein [Nitrosococcus watsonii]
MAEAADNQYAMIDYQHTPGAKGKIKEQNALGNLTGFHLTPGQACDLDSSDILLPALAVNTVLAD